VRFLLLLLRLRLLLRLLPHSLLHLLLQLLLPLQLLFPLARCGWEAKAGLPAVHLHALE